MDPQAAKEYHALLWKKLRSEPRVGQRLWWLPALTAAGLFFDNSFSGAAFGALIGWGICAIHLHLDVLERKMLLLELQRHTHEHTDEAEAGKQIAAIQIEIDRASSRWWGRRKTY